MCGIFGIVNGSNVAQDMLGGLSQLQYRGYDSAGLAVVRDGQIERRRAAGKLENLARLLDAQPIHGRTAIGHTRWATHGAPTVANAHPHATPSVAVVHNGIIENHAELRAELSLRGHQFASDTDTEVVAPLVSEFLHSGLKPRAAVAAAVRRLRGDFALAFVFREEEGLVIATRKGSPLACAAVSSGACVSSDTYALQPFSDEIVHLADGDVAELSSAGVVVFDLAGHPVERSAHRVSAPREAPSRGHFDHFTLKEIYEQPRVLRRALAEMIDDEGAIELPPFPFDARSIERVEIIACGTSRYAGTIARDWIESIAGIRADVEIASEQRYRVKTPSPNTLRIFVSQSGETADTLAALRDPESTSLADIAIVNVESSALAREAAVVLPTRAGPEIGVASTKAFTAQLAVFAALAVRLARLRGSIDAARERQLTLELADVPNEVAGALQQADQVAKLAKELARASRVLFIGRGAGHGLAQEGALKLKELSYLHAEAFAAGELKHGPIALIGEGTPVVVCAPPSATLDKTASNAHEVLSRGARVLWLGPAPQSAKTDRITILSPPALGRTWAAFASSIPLQLLAYHAASFAGRDVDQPRNLAKSVTVE